MLVGLDENLTDREEIFVLEFSRSLHRGRAARAAGYSEGGMYEAGSKLLRNPLVQQALRKEFERRAKELRLDVEFLVLQALESYFRCVEKGSDSAASKFLDMLFKWMGLYEKDNRQRAGTDLESVKNRLKERGIDVDKLRERSLN